MEYYIQYQYIQYTFTCVLVCLCLAKVRRLYDIANILSSLQLIKKVRLPLRYGMKPAYQWVGTELDTAAQQYGKTLLLHFQ